MKADVWQLNAIMLAHVSHFFQAAYQAARDLESSGRQKAGLLAALSGNIIWAKSGFVADSREEEHDLALLGALLGTLGSEVPAMTPSARPLETCVAALELEIQAHWDQILAALQEDIQGYSEDWAPSRLNAFVWQRLFPQYERGWDPQKLSQQICHRLTS